ncbi:amino acid ABC transporter substrate-binding protein [Treponema socranskii]|uniref:ABC transporter, phosphonate, periplasmic substrate-binding protein n=1 Tax=Treponema socranskii subsp. socranskii VPI DR56BR1116 = ATCC 35536 TaxID=1125725 RepID=U1GWH2_TRESO|nr:amino acid ABC transporter substrate-binding protein [Treponema socranskii]ERF60919.1 ABC transporter, phosphonate, periplasmic substrate-binding protein [Treponema socranskii subsp. socranskii VPI DR56BR1116 = ATCC 35536]ERK00165.1 ABC transporter, phosphonate, periplasmic substrate-binding protein [Treponema socranskii subsp. socranskii VPI DR56BR1116 = ATCC 35536]
MKKTIRVFLASLFALCLAAASAGCKKRDAASARDTSLDDLISRGVFVLGLDDSFPPLGFRASDGEIVGYDIDLAKEVAKRLGVEFKAQPIDWGAKEMELNTGKIDCIWNGFTMTKEREEALVFTKPYLKNAQVLVVRNDSGIASLKDMAGKTIALQSGSSAQEAVDANAEFSRSLKEQVLLKDNVTALNDLEIRGVDGVVMDSVVANYSISATGKPFIVIDEALSYENYGIAFRKGNAALRDKVQSILEDMQRDGTVTAVSVKWFGRDISVIGK